MSTWPRRLGTGRSSRLHRLLPFLHRWRQLKWGAPRYQLDARDCACGSFEVWSFTSYRPADRALFDPHGVRPAPDR